MGKRLEHRKLNNRLEQREHGGSISMSTTPTTTTATSTAAVASTSTSTSTLSMKMTQSKEKRNRWSTKVTLQYLVVRSDLGIND